MQEIAVGKSPRTKGAQDLTENEQDLQRQVEHLERQRKQDFKAQHNIIAVFLGCAIYLASGLSTSGAILGGVVAVAYLLYKKAMF